MLQKGPLNVLACYLCWGMLPLFWATLSSVGAFAVLGYRILFSLVFISLYLLLTGHWQDARDLLQDKTECRRILYASLAVFVNWGGYIWAVNAGRVVDASLAYYMNPILSIPIGAIFFKEKLTGLQWLAVGLMTAGIAITAMRYGQIPWLALLIGGSFVIYGLLKRGVTSNAAVSLFGESLFVMPLVLVCIIWCEWTGTGAVGNLSGAQWLLLPAAGVVTAVPLLFFSRGIKTTSNTLTGILMLINPTMQLLVGVLLMDSEFTDSHAILFAFIWSGLALFLTGSILQNRKAQQNAG